MLPLNRVDGEIQQRRHVEQFFLSFPRPSRLVDITIQHENW